MKGWQAVLAHASREAWLTGIRLRVMWHPAGWVATDVTPPKARP